MIHINCGETRLAVDASGPQWVLDGAPVAPLDVLELCYYGALAAGEDDPVLVEAWSDRAPQRKVSLVYNPGDSKRHGAFIRALGALGRLYT